MTARSDSPKATCLVTIHGIGFQQSPLEKKKNSGYADRLHQHLHKELKDKLSDDPKRHRTVAGDNGVIYVESRFGKSKQHSSREDGLERLGKWKDYDQSIDTERLKKTPLLNSGRGYEKAFISHIALVYSNLEPQHSEIGASTHTTGMALFNLSRYGTFLGLSRMFFRDIWAAVKNVLHPQKSKKEQKPSLVPRRDPKSQAVRKHHRSTLLALEDDVACYVTYNEERERVRSFVHGALMRLGYREDVERIILNTHSNGTVIAFDVLHYLPKKVTDKITVFATAGSPLRKYVDLFHWGNQIQCLSFVERWHNFWDPCDVVADALNPPASHRVTWSDKKMLHQEEHLFTRFDFTSKKPSQVTIYDQRVNNLKNSYGGGLLAHNYWDNREEVVSRLAEWLR
ncbi:MAG TPA: hypothetical protein VGS08_01510 [Candidatus Saccharimonadales bacterium]|nr:hypothetical protein [Candidatus Saccharimonadales bacterium]